LFFGLFPSALCLLPSAFCYRIFGRKSLAKILGRAFIVAIGKLGEAFGYKNLGRVSNIRPLAKVKNLYEMGGLVLGKRLDSCVPFPLFPFPFPLLLQEVY
jgi:hypothetical protein